MPIDLRSDTVTTPTEKMRDAMRDAVVGDDVYGEDPTINRLEQLAAEIVGKEAALFVTSGTQGNQVAVLSHTQRGDEVILEERSHIFYYETAGLATIAGVQTRTIKGINGQMPVAEIAAAIREEDVHCPKTGLICLENTHGDSAGSILPLSYMEDVYQVSRQHQIPVHLDGARLFNAAVGLGVDPKEITKYTDTVQFCLSKGLSAPMGSILAGPKELIERARKWRKMLGGGTRQAGIIGAAGIVALEEMIDRLQEDHTHAKALAEGLALIDGIDIDAESVETNMIMFSIGQLGMTAEEFVSRLNKFGVLANPAGPNRIRFVTHREISMDDIDKTIEAVKNISASNIAKAKL
ncbi:low-specificity L-threonine aldolase [Siminovitchia acidinfaciens]|uniref:Low-specificity L-threonine aldolase n=1 Tax=Siminovitchia acidinfaciens TaxID=2321395 RepID=A0A429XWM4_9BACI|nr:low-specificity L-threonine aldolase [Siminovitchia acidinfaciens]RST72792.1 low-specificity L-threonine aldolase [Siminovitchia acidinfaciens]